MVNSKTFCNFALVTIYSLKIDIRSFSIPSIIEQ
nr:MAG TPA: hypothetical protein [Crassvirales sp.]